MNRKGPGLKDKRVIIVLYALELGGAEHQALLLARHLVQAEKARVEIWGFVNPGRLVELCEDSGVPWQLVPVNLSLHTHTGVVKTALQLRRQLRRAQADVILPYLTPSNILCGLSWRWTGAQLCVWNQRNGGVERVDPAMEQWATRLTPWFISNSSQGAEFLTQTFKVEPERIRIIPNGVQLEKPIMGTAAWQQALQAKEGSFLACMVANLHHGKDHVTLLRAWQLVVRQLMTTGRDAVLALAGRFDSTEHPLRQLSQELGISEHVRFLGPVKDVAGLLGAVDVGILTSAYDNYEGCPNAVLEYMASGLPVVGTDIRGIRDVVDASAHPFLVAMGDSGALSDRLIQLAMQPELMMKLGEANRRRAAIRFTLEGMCVETAEFIKECLRVKYS